MSAAQTIMIEQLRADNAALVAERDRLLGVLRKTRGYVAEPGSPGTVIETTDESAEMSAALLAEIDSLLLGAGVAG